MEPVKKNSINLFTTPNRLDKRTFTDFENYFIDEKLGYELCYDTYLFLTEVLQTGRPDLFGRWRVSINDFLESTNRKRTALFYPKTNNDGEALARFRLSSGKVIDVVNKFEAACIMFASRAMPMHTEKHNSESQETTYRISARSLIEFDIIEGKQGARRYEISFSPHFTHGLATNYFLSTKEVWLKIRPKRSDALNRYALLNRIIELYMTSVAKQARGDKGIVKLYYPEIKKVLGVDIKGYSNNINITKTIHKINNVLKQIQVAVDFKFEYKVGENNTYYFKFQKISQYYLSEKREYLLRNSIETTLYYFLEEVKVISNDKLTLEENIGFVHVAFDLHYSSYLAEPKNRELLKELLTTIAEHTPLLSFQDVYQILKDKIK